MDDKELNPLAAIPNLTYFRGRVALYAILRALGVGKSDEVIVPAYTCLAVPEAVLALGARPVYADLVPQAVTMDPNHCRSLISSHTKAIIVQHTFGIPARMDAFAELARATGLPLIEDCAHALTSIYRGRMVGSFGDAAFYSFEWGKPLPAGLGGAAVCNNPRLREQIVAEYPTFVAAPAMRDLRISCQYFAFTVAFRPSLYWFARSVQRKLASLGIVENTYTYKAFDKAAADFAYRMAQSSRRRLCRSLDHGRIEAHIEHSAWVSDQYRTRIPLSVAQPPTFDTQAVPVYGRYPLLVDGKQEMVVRARRQRIEIADWYSTVVHPLSGKDLSVVHYKMGMCPNAENICRRLVTLPTHPKVSQRNIDQVVRFFEKA